MEDVILYNESWDVDKLSPYTTFYTEGKIINGLKKLWRAFLDILSRIKTRFQYIFKGEARNYRLLTSWLNNPNIVEIMKDTQVDKIDYSIMKESLKTGDELCEVVLSIKSVFDRVIDNAMESGTVKWTSRDIAAIKENCTKIVSINTKLKELASKKAADVVKNGCTAYDRIVDIKEIYDLTKTYFIHHDQVVKFSKDIAKVVDSLPDGKGDFLVTMVRAWYEGFSYVNKIGTTTGAGINARVDSRRYIDKIEQRIKDKERGYNVTKEYYTKGNDSMDTIIYNEKLPKNIESEPEVTTESVDDIAMSLEEVNAYIETTMADLKEAMELRVQMIQEAAESTDDSSVDGFEEADNIDESCETCDEPVKESYVLDGTAIFGESFNLEYDYNDNMPNRFVQETLINDMVRSGIYGGIVLGAMAHTYAIVTVVNSIITSARYKKRYGRFATDMQKVMDILKDSKDGTVNTKELYKALYTLKDDCDTISGKHALSFKAVKNLSATERSEIKQLSTIIRDLTNMLTKKPDKAAERRIVARIDDFVKKCETVTKLLNRGNNPGDVVKEYMS